MVNLSMFYIPNRRNRGLLLLIVNNLPLYIFPKRDIKVNKKKFTFIVEMHFTRTTTTNASFWNVFVGFKIGRMW